MERGRPYEVAELPRRRPRPVLGAFGTFLLGLAVCAAVLAAIGWLHGAR